MTDRGTPYGYRHMNGYSSHTYKWVTADGKVTYVKYHFKTNSGIKNFTSAEAKEMWSKNPYFSGTDLHEHIAKGGQASWTLCVQLMPEKDGDTYKYDIFDVTKVWP
jgi:catalase